MATASDAPLPKVHKDQSAKTLRRHGGDQLILRHGAGEGAREPTLGPKEPILRTHSMVNMAVKMRLRSLNTSMNSSGAPWNCKNKRLIPLFSEYLHCKKSWRSSSTPVFGDAGPIQTGVGKSFRHPWRQLYYKYQTFLTEFYMCRTSSL